MIGCGSVGCATALALVYSPCVEEIAVYDRDAAKSAAVALDLADAAAVNGKKAVVFDAAESERFGAMVITIGRRQRNGEDRLALYGENLGAVSGFLKALGDYGGRVIIVTNPVDRLSAELARLYPSMRIESAGTAIDGVRLRRMSDRRCRVLGTHDDGQIAEVDGAVDYELTKRLRMCAGEIIEGKGYANLGIAAVVKQIIERNGIWKTDTE